MFLSIIKFQTLYYQKQTRTERESTKGKAEDVTCIQIASKIRWTLVLPPTGYISLGNLFYACMSVLQKNQANSDYLMELL